MRRHDEFLNFNGTQFILADSPSALNFWFFCFKTKEQTNHHFHFPPYLGSFSVSKGKPVQQVIDFFSEYVDIDSNELTEIAARAHTIKHPKKAFIQKQGDMANSIGLIIKGAVRYSYLDDNGEEHITNFGFEHMPVVAFESFTQQVPSKVSIITLEPTEMYWTTRKEFFEFMELYPKYETVMWKVLGQYLSKHDAQSSLLRIGSSRERYETFCQQQPEVAQRVPLKYIASYLRMTIETLSRVRAGKL